MTPGLIAGRLATWMLRDVLPRVFRWLRLLAPTRQVAVVAGYPATEGNAVEVVRELERSYPGRVVWLDAPEAAFRRAQGLTRVEALARYSVGGVWAYLTAEAVFFTHGLYGVPTRVPGKLTVNVWHGSGMKGMGSSLLPERRVRGAAADFLVSGARVWGSYYASISELTEDEVVYCANPRVDAFRRPLPPGTLARLGLDPARPFVVWMPTFRTTGGAGLSRGWSDSDESDADARLDLAASALARRCAATGVDLVVKAHPLDAASRSLPGTVLVTGARLDELGVSLYSFLGASGGLVTDVSSVWTDYLLLDRPIGFLFPDKASYLRSRGIHPTDILDWLPGEEIVDDESASRFLADVVDGGVTTPVLRRRSAERIGLVHPEDSSAGTLMARLAATETAFARSLLSR